MPFQNATQPQMEELLAALRLVEAATQTASQGSYPAPLVPARRVQLANLSARLVAALTALEVVTGGGPALGPNDIIIDKTLPVPVRDLDTGVSASAHVTLDPVIGPLVGFTGEPVALVKEGTPVNVQLMTQRLAGTIQRGSVVGGGTGVVVNVPGDLYSIDLNDTLVVENYDGSTVDGRLLGPDFGMPPSVVQLGSGVRAISNGDSMGVGTQLSATSGTVDIQSGVASLRMPSTVAMIMNLSTHSVTNSAGGDASAVSANVVNGELRAFRLPPTKAILSTTGLISGKDGSLYRVTVAAGVVTDVVKIA